MAGKSPGAVALAAIKPLLAAAATPTAAPGAVGRLAFHPPCTLQHGQQLRGGVEAGLRELGFDVAVAMNESHLCCGSAGTYSVLQPELSHQLRDRKLMNLAELQPAALARFGRVDILVNNAWGRRSDKRVYSRVEALDDALHAAQVAAKTL